MLAREIQSLRGERWIVPLVPQRVPLFLDPNVVFTDLVRLFEEEEKQFENLPGDGAGKTLIILVLSRSEVELPRAPSPIPLPPWFPVHPGQEVLLYIEDLIRDARIGAINTEEMLLEDIAVELFELERVLLPRFEEACVERKSSAASIWSKLGLKQPVGDHLSEWRAALSEVSAPQSYRLTVGREPHSFLAALASLTARSSPDELTSLGQSLDDSLELKLPAGGVGSMVPLMYRSTSVKGMPGVGVTLMVTVFVIYNLMNAAAHAAAYPLFPVQLLGSLSRELLGTLSRLVQSVAER